MPKVVQYELQPVTIDDCILLTVGKLKKEDDTVVPGAVFKFSVKDELKQERAQVDYAVELDQKGLKKVTDFIQKVGIDTFNKANDL